MIYFISDKADIRAAKKHMYLKVDMAFQEGDLIIFDGENPIYFEVIEPQIARKAIAFSGLTLPERELFDERISTYNEVGSIDKTIGKFPYIPQETLKEKFVVALERVKKHNKINDEQMELLRSVYIDGKTKKELIKEKNCSYNEIDGAYEEFIRELPYCYGFINDAIIHRANEFNTGMIDFKWNTQTFYKEKDIPIKIVENIMEKALSIDMGLTQEEITFSKDILKRNDASTPILQCEYEEMNRISKKISHVHYKKILDFYNMCAQKLIDSNMVYIQDVKKYAVENGLEDWRLYRAMQDLGFKPGRRRSRKLAEFLE